MRKEIESAWQGLEQAPSEPVAWQQLSVVMKEAVVMTVVAGMTVVVMVVMTMVVMMVGFVCIHFQFSLSGFLMKVLEAMV